MSSVAAIVALAACGPQVTLEPGVDTGSGTGDAGGSTPPGGGSTSTSSGGNDGAPGPTVTTGPMSTTGPDPSTTTTTSPGTTDDPGVCDPPCLPGEECIAGICFGEPSDTEFGCDDWGGTGNYAPCDAGDSNVCGGAVCVADDPSEPTASACALVGCDDVCDCPDPGRVTGGVLVCDAFTADLQTACFFTCEGGTECPEGMVCLGDFFCAWPVGVPTYGDCVSGETCSAGDCIQGDPVDPSVGVCTQPCADLGECPPAPDGGTAACATLPGGMDPQCVLTCEAGTACPEGMVCFADSFCAWPVP